MNETSGVLRPVVERYIRREPLSPEDIGIMRAYLRQWITLPFGNVEGLRDSVDAIVDQFTLDNWIDHAMLVGVDPL